MKHSFIKLWQRYSYIVFLIFVTLGTLYPLCALGAIVCMVGPIFLSLIGKGRFWCGNVCPRGSFYDNVLSKLRAGKPTPKILKSIFFRFIVIIFMFSMFGIGIYKNLNNALGIALVFYKIIVITSLIGIILSFIYNERSWCHFCPMGSIAALICKIKKRNISFHVKNTCLDCNLCSKTCPMNINPNAFKNSNITSADCILCGRCQMNCPNNSIHVNSKRVPN